MSKTRKKYDIFISYRREGGEYTAKILCDKLSQLGYRVFFDVETLRAGNFNTELYKVIQECKDFLIVLSPGALERCENEDDWVRQELSCALKSDKNVVPLLLRGFEFPKHIPEEIDAVRYKNGLPADSQFFDAFMVRLETFLKSKPRKVVRWKKAISVVIASALIFLAILGAILWNHSGVFPYPRTESEKNLTRDLLYYIETNLQQIDQMAEYMTQAYEACERQLSYEDTLPESLSRQLQQYRSGLFKADLDRCVLSGELESALRDSPFSVADAKAVYDITCSFQEEFLQNIYYMEFLMGEKSVDSKSGRRDVLDNYKDLLEENLKIVSCGTVEMLLPVKDKHALQEFKSSFLPQLTLIPLHASDWGSDKEELESDEKKCNERINKIVNKISSHLGDSNMDMLNKKAEYIRDLIELGYSSEEAEAEANKVIAQADAETDQMRILQEKIRQLEKTSAELDQALEQAKKKFAPEDGDDADLLWGKMLRFLNLKLYDDALQCLDAYRETVRDEDENAEQYTAAAARFIKNIGKTGIEYGALITAYESGEKENDPRRIGDVIIAVNGAPCHNAEEYISLRDAAAAEGGEYEIVVLRMADDESDMLKQEKLTLPSGSQKLCVYSMTEKEYD